MQASTETLVNSHIRTEHVFLAQLHTAVESRSRETRCSVPEHHVYALTDAHNRTTIDHPRTAKDRQTELKRTNRQPGTAHVQQPREHLTPRAARARAERAQAQRREANERLARERRQGRGARNEPSGPGNREPEPSPGAPGAGPARGGPELPGGSWELGFGARIAAANEEAAAVMCQKDTESGTLTGPRMEVHTRKTRERLAGREGGPQAETAVPAVSGRTGPKQSHRGGRREPLKAR